MKRIIALILVLVFLAGCGITGRVVEEIEEQQTQEEKDTSSLEQALAEKDVSKCYGIQTQNIREVCFIGLAKELNDASICNNLLGRSLKNSCKAGIN